MTRALVVPLLASALAGALPAAAPARAPFVAHLRADGHHPRAGHAWAIAITARSPAGNPLAGSVRYEFVFAGRVVGRRAGHRFTGGRYRDTLHWPTRSIGIPLTFRAVVKTRLGTVRLSYAVVVRR